MSEEDMESLESLKQMCEKTNNSIHTDPIPDSSPEHSPEPREVPDPAVIFDLNDLLILALQIEDQIKFNESELLE